MKGDVLVIEAHHRRAAVQLTADLVEAIGAKGRRFLVSIAGESGSGKSETAMALAEQLLAVGFAAVVLCQDDYFVLPPKANDARRRSDPAWLGPHVEVRFDLLQANVDAALAGARTIERPVMDYQGSSAAMELLALDGVRVVIVEGTYVSLLRHIDRRIFIARTRLETLEHRRRRNRGTEAADPFIEGVLEVEHKIIAGHRALADYVVSRDFEVSRTA